MRNSRAVAAAVLLSVSTLPAFAQFFRLFSPASPGTRFALPLHMGTRLSTFIIINKN